MILFRRIIVLVLGIALIGPMGCDAFEDLGSDEDLGSIVRTDATGLILSDVPGQWNPRVIVVDGRPTGSGFGPAYPNPSTADSIVIPFITPQQTFVNVYLYSGSEHHTVLPIISQECYAGSYRFTVKRHFGKGTFRVQLATSHGLTSWGNVRFE